MLVEMTRSATRTRNTVRRKQTKAKRSWWVLWPLLLGILVTPIAVRAASVLALSGPSAMRLLYPYLVLTHSHVLQVSGEQADTLSQWILYGQFPLYGLLWMIAARLLGRSAGPLLVLLLHVGGVGAAILAANR